MQITVCTEHKGLCPLPIRGRAAVRQLMSVIDLSSENENNTVLVTTEF